MIVQSSAEFSSPVSKLCMVEIDHQHGAHKIANWDMDALLGARVHCDSFFPTHFLLHGSICRTHLSPVGLLPLNSPRLPDMMAQ
jgi:hypothetical protein